MKRHLETKTAPASIRSYFGVRPIGAGRLPRWGSVMLLIVVVVAMLTLAAYNFSQSMSTELEAAMMYTKDVQARAAADSGVEFAATLLGNRASLSAENLIHNPTLFMGQIVAPSTSQRGICRFSIIAPVERDPRSSGVRYGLMDESAKLNLNALPNMGISNDDIHTLMLNIPNMTLEITDAILDWIDSDDTVSTYGAESETYQQLQPPYKAKNGPLETIDELLMIRGITPTLLYGEDLNRNGLLDPNENDGDLSPPMDNADGVLDRGFIAFFTVQGRESNRRADGKPKININDGMLTDLYDALEKEFDEVAAKYVIGFRINGPKTPPPASKTNPPKAAAPGAAKATAPKSLQEQQVADGLQEFLTNVVKPAGGTVTRGDIDLSKGGAVPIESLWQLIGTDTTATIKGKITTLPSPWLSDASTVATSMQLLQEKLTTVTATTANATDDYLEGRININQAPREILLGLPTMTEEIVNAIIAAQQLDSNGQPSLDKISQHTTSHWLYSEGLVDLSGMISLDPYITSSGHVYRVQALGFFDVGGPVTRVEAVIDATKLPPRIISQRDLNELGRGYSRGQLLPIR
ncbi:type II secretion system minor pseudopilin [Schlesneria paludicola]|uniref:general secretion pathway protein GspK n=1 Tax=Schlesneria paludicola TaxID=360056 RepID=UPI00029B120A|nr:type II secretion system protein GspK [Schlesneria paludicola]